MRQVVENILSKNRVHHFEDFGGPIWVGDEFAFRGEGNTQLNSQGAGDALSAQSYMLKQQVS